MGYHIKGLLPTGRSALGHASVSGYISLPPEYRQLYAACSPLAPPFPPPYTTVGVSFQLGRAGCWSWRRVCSGTARRGGVCGSYGMVDEQRKR